MFSTGLSNVSKHSLECIQHSDVVDTGRMFPIGTYVFLPDRSCILILYPEESSPNVSLS